MLVLLRPLILGGPIWPRRRRDNVPFRDAGLKVRRAGVHVGDVVCVLGPDFLAEARDVVLGEVVAERVLGVAQSFL